jgi:hypothetical protein
MTVIRPEWDTIFIPKPLPFKGGVGVGAIAPAIACNDQGRGLAALGTHPSIPSLGREGK